MPHNLHDILVPPPARTAAQGMREALQLHEDGVALERQRLLRTGVAPDEVDAKIRAWLTETPPACAGLPGFRWLRIIP